MSKPAARRATAAEVAATKAEIFNKVRFLGDLPAAERAELQGAMEQIVLEVAEGPYAPTADGILFATSWEPPFKAMREFAKKFPAARVEMTSDAFHSGYWISRATYENGKTVAETTLTFNDGAPFESLFREIHGMSSEDWRKTNNTGPFRGGFAWGGVEGFDASKSELGKAEGQL